MSRFQTTTDVQQICLNGHQITDSFNNSPAAHKQFCPTCGEKTITNCPKCSAPIQGSIITIDTGYDAIASILPANVPVFCDNCGSSYPWREKIESGSDNVSKTNPHSGNRKIFIVHGHDEVIKNNVELFLKSLELTPIILHKQADLGKTIIEKVEHYSDVGFAIILLTKDDFGGALPCGQAHTDDLSLLKYLSNPTQIQNLQKKDQNLLLDKFLRWINEIFSLLKPRARQNVIFEFGYFIGLLGRHKVAALCEDGIDRPSDIDGLLYTPIDNNGIWKKKLAKEINAAGIMVDKKYL